MKILCWRSVLKLLLNRSARPRRYAQTYFGTTQPPSYKLNRTCCKILVMHAKMGLALRSICECGALDQTAVHVILECPLHRAYKRYHGMLDLQ